jgi:hypothetical protein
MEQRTGRAVEGLRISDALYFYSIYVGIIYLPPTFLLITHRSTPDQIQLCDIVMPSFTMCLSGMPTRLLDVLNSQV